METVVPGPDTGSKVNRHCRKIPRTTAERPVQGLPAGQYYFKMPVFHIEHSDRAILRDITVLPYYGASGPADQAVPCQSGSGRDGCNLNIVGDLML